MSQVRQMKYADVNISAAGDSTIIAAVTGAPIRIWQVWLEASGGANVIIPKDGSTAINAGGVSLVQYGTITFQYTGQPWWDVTISNAFKLNLSNATAVVGGIQYTYG